MLEIIKNGKPETSFMHFGDVIRIEMLDEDGRSIFGAIEQEVRPLNQEKLNDPQRIQSETI